MKHRLEAYIILVVATLLIMVGCTGKGQDTAGDSEPQASDTIYTWKAAMLVYGYQPERALQIIDSAVIVGNMSEVWADANRARVYSMTQMNEQVDSLLGGPKGAGLEKAEAIGERLLKHDSLKTNLKLKQEVLDILVYTARQQQDTVKWLQRSRELVDVYHQMGPEKETDALRTEAELGASLYFAGQQQEGLAKLDSVINLLNEKPSFKFSELDALILASKRKIFVLIAQDKYVQLLPLAIIAVLTVVVAVLLWRNLHNQRELRDKNDVLIREIRENAKLRDELRDAWRRKVGASQHSQRVLRTE